MITLTAQLFQSLVDFEACNERVRATLRSLDSPEALVTFFVNYASWNGQFANGVAALTSMIGAERGLFKEEGLPRAVADRSNYVASYIFDAARDEYDDHINPDRDSHRCLAQATLLGMTDVLGVGRTFLDQDESPAVQKINAEVVPGYTGSAAISTSKVAKVFAGIGYHLGSELLADREFSIIDEHMRSHHNDLVQKLMRTTIRVAGATHRCYAWIGVHSGHGGGVEADHFDYAIQGAQKGLTYIAHEQRDEAIEALKQGFRVFEQHHRAFFGAQMTP